MANKHEVIEAHRLHPDWTVGDIAAHLDCLPQYVSATAKRNNLVLPKRQRVPGALRTSERQAALMDLKFLREAIRKREPWMDLLRRVDDLAKNLSEAA